ncbi:terminase small subunit [Clostridium sp.]
MTEKAKYDHAGQPMKFKSVEELQLKIDEYFNSCYITDIDADGKPYKLNIVPLTVSGLAISLDCDRRTLINYGNNDEYFPTIRRAKQKIENFAEVSLWQPKIATGIAFNLKNNFGWHDKTEVESSGTLETTNKVDLTGFSVDQLKNMLKE